MKDLKHISIFVLLLALSLARYEIIENEASRNVYHSDRQSVPVVGPHPQHQTSGSETIRFHKCAMEFNYREKALFNIIEVYSKVMFGKDYLKACPPDSQMNMMKYLSNGKKIVTVEIDFNGMASGMLPKGFNNDYEQYKVDVKDDGKIKIQAEYYPGIVRALDTLSQLVSREEPSDTDYAIKFAPILINDNPKYPYRGVMLDTSREYFYPDAIKQLLDGMMISKLNVFHWHFADSDSFPMYLQSYPDLTNYTAFRPNEIYTPEDVEDIVKYASVRGIRVIPELEGPAHSNALGHYPELTDHIACFTPNNDTSRRHVAQENAAFDPLSPKTYEFLKNCMKDIKFAFGNPEIYHLGGDEVEVSCWRNLPSVKNWLKSNTNVNDLKQTYTEKERKLLTEIDPNARSMYWYSADRLNYKNDDILQYWGNSRAIKDEMAAERNNHFVLSPKDKLFLDSGYPEYTGHGRGRTVSWKNFFSFDIDGYNSNGKALGAETVMFSHMCNEFDFLVKIFPRASALGMKLWNTHGPTSNGEQIEMMMRNQYRLKAFGVPTEKISMRYCEEHTHHCFGI